MFSKIAYFGLAATYASAQLLDVGAQANANVKGVLSATVSAEADVLGPSHVAHVAEGAKVDALGGAVKADEKAHANVARGLADVTEGVKADVLNGVAQVDEKAHAAVARRHIADVNEAAKVSALGLANVNENAHATVGRRSRHARALVDADIGLNVSVNLQDVTDVVTKALDSLEGLTDITEDTVKPILDEVTGALQGLPDTLEGLLGGLTKRSFAKRAPDTDEKVKALFQGVADLVGKVEDVAQDVPVVGDLLSQLTPLINPVLSKVLNLLSEILGPLAEDLLKTLDDILKPVEGLLGDVLGTVTGLLGGLLGGL